jgi:predicted DNA-binding transcriptional regulator AlpA
MKRRAAPPRRPAGKALRINEVLDALTVSEATLYRLIRRGTFPRGTAVSPGRVVWWEYQVEEYQMARRQEAEG